MIEKYINAVVEFNYNGKTNYGVILAIKNDKSILCYRVVQRTKLSNKYIPILNTDGTATGFQIQHNCRFLLPNARFKKILFFCPTEIINEANQNFSKLPTLSELREEKQKLQKAYIHLPPADAKQIRHRLNVLSELINDLSANFLLETAKKKEPRNKYSNLKTVPNKDGIHAVYQGGSCSKK